VLAKLLPFLLDDSMRYRLMVPHSSIQDRGVIQIIIAITYGDK
jgi:hypothetical protein